MLISSCSAVTEIFIFLLIVLMFVLILYLTGKIFAFSTLDSQHC